MKAKRSNSSQCFGCGSENTLGLQLVFYLNEDQQVESQMLIPEQFQGFPGVVHGGIVATILDESIARAATAANPNRIMLTGKLTTRYRKPTPVGMPLRAVGEVIRDRGRMVECASYLYDQDGELLAQAEGLMVDLPPEMEPPSRSEAMS